jgi:hypothetical protein
MHVVVQLDTRVQSPIHAGAVGYATQEHMAQLLAAAVAVAVHNPPRSLLPSAVTLVSAVPVNCRFCYCSGYYYANRLHILLLQWLAELRRGPLLNLLLLCLAEVHRG